MAFHIPPSTGWKREAVRGSLLEEGLPSRVESGVLLVDVSQKHRPSPVVLFLRKFALYRRIFGSGYAPYHEFRFHEDRVVNNVEIHWNVDALVENDHVMSVVRDAMTSHGYPEVGLKPTERELIQRYGVIGNELDATLTKLESLRAASVVRRPIAVLGAMATAKRRDGAALPCNVPCLDRRTIACNGGRVAGVMVCLQVLRPSQLMRAVRWLKNMRRNLQS